MESLSLNANETFIVEDSKIGLISGIKSKAKVIGITTSLTNRQIKEINKKICVVHSYDDIITCFQK